MRMMLDTIDIVADQRMEIERMAGMLTGGRK